MYTIVYGITNLEGGISSLAITHLLTRKIETPVQRNVSFKKEYLLLTSFYCLDTIRNWLIVMHIFHYVLTLYRQIT